MPLQPPLHIHLYPRPEVVVWTAITVIGASVSLLSLRELQRGIEAVQKVAASRPFAHEVLRMSQRNRVSESARFVAQALFCLAGVLSLISKPRRYRSPPGPIDVVLPWILVCVEGILVLNSTNEYIVSRQTLARRAAVEAQRNRAKRGGNDG